MSEYIKKKSKGFYFSLVGMILTIVAVIAYWMDATASEDVSALIMVASLCSIVVVLAVMGISGKVGNKRYLNCGSILQSVLIAIAVTTYIYYRVNHIGWAIVGYEPWGIPYLVATVAYILALFVTLIGSFFSQAKEEYLLW